MTLKPETPADRSKGPLSSPVIPAGGPSAPQPGHSLIPGNDRSANTAGGLAGTAPSRTQQPEQSVPGDPSVQGRPHCETGDQPARTSEHHREPKRQPQGGHAGNAGERPPPQPDPATTQDQPPLERPGHSPGHDTRDNEPNENCQDFSRTGERNGLHRHCQGPPPGIFPQASPGPSPRRWPASTFRPGPHTCGAPPIGTEPSGRRPEARPSDKTQLPQGQARRRTTTRSQQPLLPPHWPTPRQARRANQEHGTHPEIHHPGRPPGRSTVHSRTRVVSSALRMTWQFHHPIQRLV